MKNTRLARIGAESRSFHPSAVASAGSSFFLARLHCLRRFVGHEHDDRGHDAERGGAQKRPAPSHDGVEVDQRRRRGGVAEHAREGVVGEHAAGALDRNVPPEQRVVGRVVDGVAEPRDCEHRDEHPERVDQPRDRKRAGADQQARHQHVARVPAVDQESDRRLPDRRDDVEYGERKAELGIAHAVVFLDEDEQRREQQDVVVADEMREADAGDESRLRRTWRGGQGQLGNLGHFFVSWFSCATNSVNSLSPREGA